ncbi:MAG: molybdenum cofactor biosynthesis protein MoaE [Polyangiaceae bacterium]|nr:molybdenum cofactor biosynthesis protein MoaE [Polyangiaceae bacterium]
MVEEAVITVRYFAAARDLAGVTEERLPWARAASRSALDALLVERHPRLAPHLSRMRLAINGEIGATGEELRAGDEVDVLPPVAGGSPVALCRVSDTPLSIDECFNAVRHPSAGGVALFVGVVRDHAEGKPVARLDYEAHPTLAAREMHLALESAAAVANGVRVAATHRAGSLAVGDLAVVVAASAPHRAEAFEACRHAIERIKETVPIWKHEWDADGNAHWVNLE